MIGERTFRCVCFVFFFGVALILASKGGGKEKGNISRFLILASKISKCRRPEWFFLDSSKIISAQKKEKLYDNILYIEEKRIDMNDLILILLRFLISWVS